MTGLSNGFVVLMGMGTVFIGLVSIVLICNLMSIVIRSFVKEDKKTAAPSPALANAPEMSAAEKSAVVAGICACIAEELGTDCSNIKVVSFKRV